MRSEENFAPARIDDRGGAFILDTLASLLAALPIAGFVETVSPLNVFATTFLAGAVWSLTIACAWAWLECGPRHATFGKRACGLVVVPADGKPLTFRRMLMRNLTKILVPFPLNAFIVLVRPSRITVHDRIAKTRVTRRSDDGE